MMQIKGNDEYVDSGPPFLILLHPALGPLWEVSRQKVSLQYWLSCVLWAVSLSLTENSV